MPPGRVTSLLRWAAVGALSGPLLGGALVTSLFSRAGGEALLRRWCRTACRLFNIRVRVIDHNGSYRQPPYLFVQLNQTSLSESFVTFAALPRRTRIIANLEYAAVPLLGQLVVALGAIVVVRQWPRQARRAIDRAAAALRSGDCLYISIEGRRSPDGELSPYKKGPAVLAIRSGARVVPVVIHGAREVLPFGEWRVSPGTVTFELLPEIEVSSLRYQDRDALVARLLAIYLERRAATAPGPSPGAATS